MRRESHRVDDDEEVIEERYLSEIEEALRREGYRYVVIRYPDKKRSVDIVIDRKALIRIVKDVANIDQEEYYDLLAGEALLGLSVLIISEKFEGEEIESGLVFEKKGVSVVNKDTLISYVSGEKISIYQWRGSFYLKIDHEKLREAREKKGMSIGEVAEILRVSRKTVYEYERGSMDPDIDHAERLIELFGEEIAGRTDLFSNKLHDINREKIIKRLVSISLREDDAIKRITERGAVAVKMWRTAPDVIGVFRNNQFTITRVSSDKSLGEIRRKIGEALKFSRYTGCRAYIVSEALDREVEDMIRGEKDIEILRKRDVEKHILSDLSK